MKNKYLIIIVIALSALYVSCKSSGESEKKEEHEVLAPNEVELNAEQIKTAGIQFGNVEQKQISSTLKLNGTIAVTPQSYATVCAPYGGFIKNTDLIQGSPVSKGQTLALIENIIFIEIQQSYLETKAKFDFAEKEYNRQKDLFGSNVNSAKTFQQAEADYKTLKAQLNGYIQKLAILGIDFSKLKEEKISSVLPLLSPISGFVKTVNVNIGKSINSTDVLFEIINTQNLTVELIAFEKDLHKIAIGQKIKFKTGNSIEREYTATVYQIGKALDNDKTAKIYASIEKPDNNLIAGMYINADVEIANNLVTSLPITSIVQFDEKFYVFAFKEKLMEKGKEVTRYEVIEIKKGAESNGFAEVIFPNGFDFSKKQIVVKGAYTILSKFKNAGEMSC